MPEMKNSKKLAIAAMLMAISVVIGIICKNLFTFGLYYRFTLENLPVILAAVCFGPWYGAAVGVGADLISCVCSTNPNVNPIISVGALAVGLCAGTVARYIIKEKGHTQVAVAVALAHLVGQVGIKSIGKIVYFSMPYEGILIGLGVSVVAGAIEYLTISRIYRDERIMDFLRG